MKAMLVIDMPKKCSECPLDDWCDTHISKIISEYSKKRDDRCPLVPLNNKESED